MKVNKTAGLLAVGGVNLSFFSRWRSALAGLGPVKGFRYRVARRIVNGLHAGVAVHEYSELSSTKWIWLFAPDDAVDALAAELSAAISLQGKTVVILETPRSSASFAPLLPHAKLATVNVVPEFEEGLLVAEGHDAVVLELEKLARADGRKLLAIRANRKAVYLSGVLFSSQMLLPWLTGAVTSLRSAGVGRVDAARIVQVLGAAAMRSALHASEKAWNPGAPAHEAYRVLNEWETLRSADPRFAALFEYGSSALREFFDKDRSARARARAAG